MLCNLAAIHVFMNSLELDSGIRGITGTRFHHFAARVGVPAVGGPSVPRRSRHSDADGHLPWSPSRSSFVDVFGARLEQHPRVFTLYSAAYPMFTDVLIHPLLG